MAVTKLSLEIIENFKLPKKVIRPDWDDAGYEFTLPSGIILTGFFVLNNAPCKTDSLEGMDGYIYIQTQEELEELISLNYEQTLNKIKEKNPEFDIEQYIDR